MKRLSRLGQPFFLSLRTARMVVGRPFWFYAMVISRKKQYPRPTSTRPPASTGSHGGLHSHSVYAIPVHTTPQPAFPYLRKLSSTVYLLK